MLVIQSLYVVEEKHVNSRNSVAWGLVGDIGTGQGEVIQGPQEEQVPGGKLEPQSQIGGAAKPKLWGTRA